jgi:tRNA pseudouridine13 synthase
MVEGMSTSTGLPLLTAELPGIGGVLRSSDEDFRVDEIAAYEPSGSGDHVLARIEKRGVTTFEAVRALARALDVPERDIGTAGLKDRRAVSTQLVSFPPPTLPDAVMAVAIPGVRALAAARHPHKLRTGHLRGNRFALRLRSLSVSAIEAADRARRILSRLESAPGAPNWFGAQRFGRGGKTAEDGRALVLGQLSGRRAPRGLARRLCVSAYQSLLFNEMLRRRIDDGLFATVIGGDVLKKTDTGGVFACEDLAVDQARLDRGELVPTGPMFGHSMMSPADGTEAARRELALLAEQGLNPTSFRALGKIATGTRRALAVRPLEAEVAAHDDDSIEIRFALPAGSYATAVMREVIKGPTDFPE